MSDVLKPFDRDYFIALLLLMPGFLSHQVMKYFGPPQEGGDFEVIASSLAFSLFDFVIVAVAWGVYKAIMASRSGEDSGRENQVRLTPGFVALVLVVSVVVGLAAAWADSKGVAYKIISPTSRISRTPPWETMWERCRPTWARVSLSDGRIYFGYMVYFSEGGESTQVVLNRVYNEDKSGKLIKLKATRLLLFGKDITSVEIFPALGTNKCQDEKDF